MSDSAMECGNLTGHFHRCHRSRDEYLSEYRVPNYYLSARLLAKHSSLFNLLPSQKRIRQVIDETDH